MGSCIIEVVFFDFGGVIAEEGFRNGLKYIAVRNGLDPEEFFEVARELIFSCGYLTGHATEHDYWHALRLKTGIQGEGEEFRKILLDGFIIREWMLELVRNINGKGIRTAILSDQTDWLDELEQKYHFFSNFERVFNSYYLGKSKYDASLFEDMAGIMGVPPGQALFIDDSDGNVERAKTKGLHAIHYEGKEQFFRDIGAYIPGIKLPG